MGEPVVTMSRPDHATSPLRGAAERRRGAWGNRPNPFLDERPAGFDRVEIMRVRRQEAECGAQAFNELPYLASLVGREIVHHDNVAAAQMPDEMAANPLNKPGPVIAPSASPA